VCGRVRSGFDDLRTDRSKVGFGKYGLVFYDFIGI